MAGKKIVPNYHDGNYSLTDGNAYPVEALLLVTSATYTKTIAEGRENKFHSWLVPFDHTITAADTEKFTFYKLYMIANAIAPDATMTDDIWMYVRPMQADDVLHANMPYLYKPKEAVTNYVFTNDNNWLKPKADGAVATMQTMEDTYTLYGTYAGTTATAQDPFYYMNTSGSLSLGNNGTVTVGAFRWIMRVESKFGSTPAYACNIIIFDGEETTGIRSIDNGQLTIDNSWYTIDGRKLDGKPTAKGIYVNNGRKVVIK